MSHITVKSVNSQLLSAMRISADRDIECVTYHFEPKDATMYAYMHFRNGFVITGQSLMTTGSVRRVAEERARNNAQLKAIMIEQYLLTEKLYQAAIKEAKDGVSAR